jgi:hypothetical protein
LILINKILIFFRNFKDDVQNKELDFLIKLGEIWNKDGDLKFFLSPEVIGRSQFNTELLEGFLVRNPHQRKRFMANDTDASKKISTASRRYLTSAFLAFCPMGRRLGASGRTIHTYVLIVTNENNFKTCK